MLPSEDLDLPLCATVNGVGSVPRRVDGILLISPKYIREVQIAVAITKASGKSVVTWMQLNIGALRPLTPGNQEHLQC